MLFGDRAGHLTAFREALKQVTGFVRNTAARIFHFDPDRRSAGQYIPAPMPPVEADVF
jgi:hypothetical protein